MNVNVETEQAILTDNVILSPKTKKQDKSKELNHYIHLKRVLDVLFSCIGLVALSPILLIIGLLIKWDSEGPIFFAHNRIGKNGKMFKMYKFRTMYNHAEEMIKDFTPEQMKEWKENYKLTNDPRITKMGKFLRKTSIDELPQIINIIKGDLSIIGPRPVIKEELEKYGENKEEFLSVTPGLTGYWACNGRSAISYEERMKMELYYIEHMSLDLDVQIFFKTILSVIKKEGAI